MIVFSVFRPLALGSRTVVRSNENESDCFDNYPIHIPKHCLQGSGWADAIAGRNADESRITTVSEDVDCLENAG